MNTTGKNLTIVMLTATAVFVLEPKTSHGMMTRPEHYIAIYAHQAPAPARPPAQPGCLTWYPVGGAMRHYVGDEMRHHPDPTPTPTSAPLPASAFLLATGLLGLVGIGRATRKGARSMTPEERVPEPMVEILVTFRPSMLEKITEASASLGMSAAQYIAIGAVVAAREDLGRLEVFRKRWTGAGTVTP